MSQTNDLFGHSGRTREAHVFAPDVGQLDTSVIGTPGNPPTRLIASSARLVTNPLNPLLAAHSAQSPLPPQQYVSTQSAQSHTTQPQNQQGQKAPPQYHHSHTAPSQYQQAQNVSPHKSEMNGRPARHTQDPTRSAQTPPFPTTTQAQGQGQTSYGPIRSNSSHLPAAGANNWAAPQPYTGYAPESVKTPNMNVGTGQSSGGSIFNGLSNTADRPTISSPYARNGSAPPSNSQAHLQAQFQEQGTGDSSPGYSRLPNDSEDQSGVAAGSHIGGTPLGSMHVYMTDDGVKCTFGHSSTNGKNMVSLMFEVPQNEDWERVIRAAAGAAERTKVTMDIAFEVLELVAPGSTKRPGNFGDEDRRRPYAPFRG
ncbi:uncharacterized protein AB675_8072 [Cyphellophora attinorum]|uniref:Uncharacterized protein n=1 Tax=Cyphellophora attinorum TaxID=1664694 RepID=A0A0N0NNB5_9EURO|nr:uncharacterized protein AB675_8072 [Phialophora attinorum]KPI41179.1 hypothetical protein AB675_8072 [Phialophora attinorum]